MKKSEIKIGKMYRRKNAVRKVMDIGRHIPVRFFHQADTEMLEYQEIINRWGKPCQWGRMHRNRCTLAAFAQWAQEIVE